MNFIIELYIYFFYLINLYTLDLIFVRIMFELHAKQLNEYHNKQNQYILVHQLNLNEQYQILTYFFF